MLYRRLFVACAFAGAALLTSLCGLRSLADPPPASAPPFIWVEGEAGVAPGVTEKYIKRAGWGHPEYLSGDKWLNVSVDDKDVDSAVPTGGIVLQYSLDAPKAGSYAVWNRVGFEYVRSPFSWRIDNGDWKTTKPTDLTTDLMELATWTEVAWLKLSDGEALSAGPHTLQIRLQKSVDAKGKTERILYASDALVLTMEGTFHPNSKYKPGETAPVTTPTTHFTLPTPTTDGTRTSLPLNGTWEICRDDEMLPGLVAEPIHALPTVTNWTTIAVPGDKNSLRPDLLFAHRVWYRTKITVPNGYTGRSFALNFPINNLNTTVYVNGTLCGFEKNPYCPFDIDITKAVKLGGENDVWVGIRDAWYGYSASPTNPMKLREKFNLPLEFANKGFQDFAYPVWNGFQSGILGTPTLTVAGGPAYVSDVFCKPGVAKKQMEAEVTVANPTAAPVSGEVRWEAVNVKTGQTEKTFQPRPFTVGANGKTTVLLSEVWANPKLWWPDPNPELYRLRTTLTVGAKLVDISQTTFGFREWGVSADGLKFTLNGQPWRIWADLQSGDSPTRWLSNYRRTNQRLMRLFGIAQGGYLWQGMTPNAALDFFDRNGVVVRRCGPLDGETIGYNAIESDPELKAFYKSDIKRDLLNNTRDQMVAQVKGERNHPSVMLWSLENEYLYINCINLYGGYMDDFEREITRMSEAVRAVDPTRLTMTDGGGATKAQTLPVHGDHYVAGDFARYPSLAYEDNPTGGGRGRWQWDKKRPRFIGEDYFASGINPAEYATIGGESAFVGKTAAKPASGLMYRMLTEGYRWGDYAAWHLWTGPDMGGAAQYKDQAPVAVFCRQWDWTFGPSQKIKRTLGIFNDSHNAAPLTLTHTLTIGGKVTERQVRQFKVAPGTSHKFDVLLPIPAASAPRTPGTWILALSQSGKEVFRETKIITVLNPRRTSKPVLSAKQLLVFDPQGAVQTYLKGQGRAFTPLSSLAALPATGKLLIVGKDALTDTEATSPRLAAWTSAGRGVIVLEQKNPLKYQGLPAQMESAQNEGRIGFREDDKHPAFQNLTDADFFTWSGEKEVIYRDAYDKPTSGGKSLLQVDKRLGETALAEISAGKGVLLISQLLVGETLARNAVAQQLLNNLIDYAAGFKPIVRPVTLTADAASRLPDALGNAGIAYKAAPDPLKAISGKDGIAVIQATPANLQTLAANLPKIQAFNASGGWIVFNGLTPDGLASYNKIVGVDHMIRPFRQERVTFPAKKNPLTAGLSTGDIVLSSGERINGYTQDEYTADDEFSYVVDFDEVGSFLAPPDPARWGLKDTTNDHNPLNAVNGYTGADSWKLAFMIWAPDPKNPPTYPIALPKSQELTRIEWVGNAIYQCTKQIQLVFDSGKTATFDTNPDGEQQFFDLPPGCVGKNITLKITAWTPSPTPENKLVGIDYFRLYAKRSPAFRQTVRPILTVGGLMEYTRGAGGMVLCNVLFKETESVPVNAEKKRKILATILRNLHAPVGGTNVIVGSGDLQYTPVDLAKAANQYRTDRGWFGDSQFTFADLPTGNQNFGGVPFRIYDFPTSPVPTAVMLGGNGVPGGLPDAVRGIVVNNKADALFFLQTARIDAPRDERERREKKQYEMAHYIVHYVDGKTENVPVYAEINIGDYHPKAPAAGLSGAALVWTRRYSGTDRTAAAYQMQWNNPHPEVAIASIDLEYGKDRRGIPVLLALTVASARKR